MRNPITVTLTSQDVANGKPGCPFGCVIAQALHRAGYPEVYVGRDVVEIDQQDKYIHDGEGVVEAYDFGVTTALVGRVVTLK